jgi:hypothetical protein
MATRALPLRPILAIWFVLALTAAVLLPAPRAAPPLRMLLILGPVIAFAIALRFVPRLSAALERFEPRWIVALHGMRAVIGAVFLALGSAGQLPHEFTTPAGIGDLTVGAAGLVLVACWPWAVRHRGVLVAWNVLGILDFMNVQRIATFTLRGRETDFLALDHLPLSFVPYFVVPFLFATHVWLLARRNR